MDELNRQRKDDGRVLFRRDLGKRLQVPKRDRHRLGGNHGSSLSELLGRLEFAGCVNDFTTLLTLGFSLTGHRTLHIGRKVDMLHLYG